MGVRDPRALLAAVKAISLVFLPSKGSKSSDRSVIESRQKSRYLMVAPARLAAWTHGATLASWSSRETRISSPMPKVGTMASAAWNAREVMLGPKITRSGSLTPRNAAPSSPACRMMDSTFKLVWNGAPRLALAVRMASAIAAATEAVTWVPPGPSRKTHGSPLGPEKLSAGKAFRASYGLNDPLKLAVLVMGFLQRRRKPSLSHRCRLLYGRVEDRR